jgi:glycosyltransferase involved in cell wall biosynthesis
MKSARSRVCWVCATPATFDAFLVPHVARLGDDFEMTVVTSGRPRRADDVRARYVALPISRKINPVRDVISFAELWRFFRRERFDAVHSFTPKAGLLGMASARVGGTPRRFHTFTGQVWANKRGVARRVLKSADRLLAACATRVLADSRSQAQFLVDQGIVRVGGIDVIENGSICGVDTERFKPDPVARRRVRDELGIPDAGRLILFVGRLNRDKGVLDLMAAFETVCETWPDVWLLFVGPDEADMRVRVQGLTSRDAGSRVLFVQATPQPERFMAAADVLCLPSYRKGFGSVIIEAAACGCPCIASRVYGVTDAVEENVTGFLHLPGDVEGLRDCLGRVCADPAQARVLGTQACQRAHALFGESRVTEGLARWYREEFVAGPDSI